MRRHQADKVAPSRFESSNNLVFQPCRSATKDPVSPCRSCGFVSAEALPRAAVFAIHLVGRLPSANRVSEDHTLLSHSLSPASRKGADSCVRPPDRTSTSPIENG